MQMKMSFMVLEISLLGCATALEKSFLKEFVRTLIKKQTSTLLNTRLRLQRIHFNLCKTVHLFHVKAHIVSVIFGRVFFEKFFEYKALTVNRIEGSRSLV